MQRILTDIESATKDSQIQQAYWDVKRQIQDTYQIGIQNKVDEQVIDDKVATIKAEAIGSSLVNELTRANINLSEARIKEIANTISQKWEQVSNRS